MKVGRVIIIGGGLGGLFTGALLARNGMTVTVLEKNATCGGGLQCFRRSGKVFETGMHVLGGFGKNGNLSKICSYLGILKDLNIQHVPSECMDEIIYQSQGVRYRIASGRERFVECMSSYFPDEAEGIKAYVDALYQLTEELPLYYLKENTEVIAAHSAMFSWPADKFIAYYVNDARLREVLAYLNPLYAGESGRTPAYVHALVNVLFINGASRFNGGSQQLADALAKVIADNGGEVLCGMAVAKIIVKDSSIVEVRTADGRSFTGEWYISAIHPDSLAKLIQGDVYRRSFIKKMQELPNSYSAFSMYIDLKPNAFPYIDHTCYFVEDFGMMWNQDKVNEGGIPKVFMYMTPPEVTKGKYASRLLVHAAMSFDQVRRWENTGTGHRGDDYKQWKAATADSIIRQLESIYPDIREMIKAVYTSSPLTIRDFLGTKEGAMFGRSKDCSNMMLSHLPVATRVKNLLLTGQNVSLHGICGVPLTAIRTAEAILGPNTLVNAINHAYEAE